jgi:hypothetical protein
MPECTLSPTTLRVKNRPRITSRCGAAPSGLEADESVDKPDSVVELIQPDSMPAVVRIVWQTAPTITTPARYNEIASTAMRLLAEASTTLVSIKASGGCDVEHACHQMHTVTSACP